MFQNTKIFGWPLSTSHYLTWHYSNEKHKMNEDRYLNNTQTFWNYLKKIILVRPSSRVSRQFENLGKYVWLLTSVWANVIFWCLWPVAVTSGGSGPLIIIMMPGVSSDNISWSSVNIVSNKDWWPLEVSNCEIKLKIIICFQIGLLEGML